MSNVIREAFERNTFASFGLDEKELKRSPTTGVYINSTVEDHWQTFQEGWEAAIEHLTNKTNSCYSDIVSNGGMDPR